MKRKKCFLAILICVIFLNGCGYPKEQVSESEEAKIYSEEITLMHVDADKASFKNYISEVEKELNMEIHLVQSLQNADNRHAQISTILSSGDSSVDVIGINDEMMSEFKSKGYLDSLNETVMDEVTLSHYPVEYMKKIAMYEGDVYSVPYSMDIMVYWVNDEILKRAGICEVESKQSFDQLLEKGRTMTTYGYGGAWEESYVYNEIIQFINMFGGDYTDWGNDNNRIAMEYLFKMMQNDYIPQNQLLDQYDQMLQKFLQGHYGSIFMYSGAANTFFQSDMNVDGKIHMEKLPEFMNQTTNIATWQYVLNSSSQKKESAEKFLNYVASKEGQMSYSKHMNVLPARLDVIYEEELTIPYIDVIRSYIDNVKLEPRTFTEQPMKDIRNIGKLFCEYVTGKITLDDFCVQMQQNVDGK